MAARENFHVFLRADIPAEAKQFFAQFVRRATFKDGPALDYLACSSVTTTGRFFDVVVYPPESEKPWPMQIPQTSCSWSPAPSTQETRSASSRVTRRDSRGMMGAS
jgi:hypothetical protein